MNSKVLAESILKLVGGEGNVSALVHCATRLRFKINDIGRVDITKLEVLDGVITVVQGAGQLQVVIGNRVPEVYREFGAISSLLNDSRDSAPTQTRDKDGTVLGRLVDVVSAIFTPLLGAMAAAGVLKGLLAIAVALGWQPTRNSSYIILHAASDSLFYFLPMLLAITSARKFGANVFVAVSLAGALVYPSIQGLFDAGANVSFFGIPVVMMKYTTSVIPIILSVWLMSYLERFLNRHIHESVRNILTPFILLAVMVPLTLMTVGPLGISFSKIIATAFVTIYGFNPIVASALFAALWQVFVIFGVHWGFVTLFINDLSVLGRSFLKAATGPAVFSQSGALLAVMIRARDKKLRALAGSTFIASLFGITEPGVYGITLKLKRPFICAVCAAALGGAVVGYARSSAMSMGMTSLLTVPIFYGDGFMGFVLGCVVAFIASLLLTLMVGFDEAGHPACAAAPTAGPAAASDFAPAVPAGTTLDLAGERIGMPINGELIALSQVNDKVFSSGVVGQGVAILPAEGRVYAPMDSRVMHTFASGHALGLQSDYGAEILIHVGIDTVQLQGRYYRLLVAEGDRVRKGQLLIEFDLEAIAHAGYDTVTPVVITNADDYPQINTSNLRHQKVGDTIITLA
ncbi:beta-glucoside-specific PTS transporter subunit IIABC [Acerihabitans arboris]|uniref:PTS transporter subunit EIIC n=1 Tax=Acerihabitans arboris TaxID=2691583 RepID=A0A845SHL6_9GAMM|nr:beta-glucoside-specific PTS transporter subunit IIABC [Acerihabitans arboris]NDL62111.1 PTS transporter subunit EIIC [Acerihabitans arboris]